MVPPNKDRVKGQGSKHSTEIVDDCDLVKIMLSRLFLRRYSLLSRTRSLPLRGDIENAPGNVSFSFSPTLCYGVHYLEF